MHRIDNLFRLNYSYKDIIRELTLTTEEREKTLKQKTDYNRVAYATNILLLKSMSIMTNDLNLFKKENKDAFEYICKQVNVNTDVDISKYCNKTYLRHRASILKEMNYTRFNETDEIRKKLFNIVMSTSSRFEIIRYFIQYLKDNKIVLPSRQTLEKLVNKAIKYSDDYIYKKIVEQVTEKEHIEGFISTSFNRLTDFNTVKNLGKNKSEKNKRRGDIEKKIEVIERYELNIDLKFIHINKRKQLYERVEHIRRESIAKIKDENKRIAYIIIFIKLYEQKLKDELIIYDRNKYSKNIRKLVTKRNLISIYERFDNKVIINNNIKSRYKIEIFLDLVINGCKGYKKVEDKYILNNYKDIYINKREYDIFKKEIILSKYTSKEKKEILSNADMIIERQERSKTGSYYTSQNIVSAVHSIMIQEFGANWYNEYIVYDSAAGTNNLTRDYKFKNLYTSTLEQQELEASKMYNKEAIKFRYDFINDTNNELQISLIKKFKNNEKIIFFINPPYKKLKENLKTQIGHEMNLRGLGVSSEQLITQFLYRILKLKEKYNLTNVHIAMLSDINFMQRPGYKSFRDIFLEEFEFRRGAIFDSKNFEGVSGNWPVSFNIWNIKNNNNVSKNYFKHELIEESIDKLNFKTIYNTDNIERLTDWIKNNIKSSDSEVVAYFKNLGYKVEENSVCKIIEEKTKGSIEVGQDNISIISSVFAARKLIKNEWGKNTIDNYLVPDITHWYYKKWNRDANIYMIFHESVREYTNVLEDEIFINEDYKNLIDKVDISYEAKELLIEAINVANSERKEWTVELDMLYKRLSNKMEQYVYVLGFLK